MRGEKIQGQGSIYINRRLGVNYWMNFRWFGFLIEGSKEEKYRCVCLITSWLNVVVPAKGRMVGSNIILSLLYISVSGSQREGLEDMKLNIIISCTSRRSCTNTCSSFDRQITKARGSPQLLT